jgi:hypothetical protein
MRDNAHPKRTSFWKSLIAAVTITLSIFSHTEARVTREVAEATIHYLLEAVGIPATGVQATDDARRDAIVHMIYTDAGQREMVDWAVNNNNPVMLTAQFLWPNPSSNVIRNPNAQAQNQERVFRLLFPCGPGTFSSYAANNSRLGYHALNNAGANLVAICSAIIGNHAAIIQGNANGVHQIINKFNNAAHAIIDNKLAKVLFVLDVCDTAIQIKNILNQVIAGNNQQRNNTIDQAIANHAVFNEYDHRPVSATSVTVNIGQPNVHQEGDCVQTLYRHLINIAVQNDTAHPTNYNIDHLPAALQGYYTALYGIVNNHVVAVPVTQTEAGRMTLIDHDDWNADLSHAPNIGNIVNGAADDIVRVLTFVCPLNNNQPNMAQSNLGAYAAAAYQAPGLNPIIQTSQGAPLGGTNQQANATALQNALNALDGRCNVGNERFIVNVTDDMAAIGANGLPNNTDVVIQIADRLWNRTITIGARTAGIANAHAEIASIN